MPTEGEVIYIRNDFFKGRIVAVFNLNASLWSLRVWALISVSITCCVAQNVFFLPKLCDLLFLNMVQQVTDDRWLQAELLPLCHHETVTQLFPSDAAARVTRHFPPAEWTHSAVRAQRSPHSKCPIRDLDLSWRRFTSDYTGSVCPLCVSIEILKTCETIEVTPHNLC